MDTIATLSSPISFDEAFDLLPSTSTARGEEQQHNQQQEQERQQQQQQQQSDLSGDEPALGMEFDSAESARSFYCAYADRVGFRIRNSKSFTSRVDDSIIMRRFVCSRQGRPTKKDPFDLSKKRRNRLSTRQGCPAMLQVNRLPSGSNDSGNYRWSVSRLVLEHSHPLGALPESNSSKKSSKKPWELLLCDATQQPIPQLVHHGLGPGGGVAQSLLEYFKKMQADNPAFFYAVQLDSDNCLANVFWADARARMTYSHFGDAVTLDFTCKRNKRAVPFGAFTGVNHHREFVVFGCAFVTDETLDSFLWLFETWLMAMGGQRPVSITIPYDEVVESAACSVLPDVRRRFCKKDVFGKCKEKLAQVYVANAGFKAELKKCVNEPVNVDEFEVRWKNLIQRYDLVDSVWLQSLYHVREKWIPVYLRSYFFAELPWALKLENMHKFFQRNSITTTTLRDLVSQFDKAMAGIYEKEAQADIAMINARPVLKTPSPMEKQASEIYTREIFDLFQEELVESSSFMLDKLEDDGIISTFRVTKAEDRTRSDVVTYNAHEKAIRCTCCMFEHSGILCRHAFRVFLVVGIVNLPEEYVLRRWARNAKSNTLSIENGSFFQNDFLKPMTRCNDLCRDAIRYAAEGATSAAINNVAKSALQKAFAEVFTAKRGPFEALRYCK